jgi:outer membrane lipoprotein SlyB
MPAINKILPGLFAIVTFFSFALPPNVALAEQYAAPIVTPKIDGFDVQPARRLTAGNELSFTLYGTPGGTANARINGVQRRIYLEEVELGVYEGTYTIRKNDRLTANTRVTANLRLGNQIATDILDEPILAGSRPLTARPTVVAAAPTIPRIEHFELDAPASLQPGEQLFFTLRGTPGGKASMRIAGVKGKLLMEEVRSGIYEEAYTIKQRDRITADSKITATLSLGNLDTSSALDRTLSTNPNSTPSARRAAKICANCGVIEAVNIVEVKGDGGYVGKIAGGVIGGLIGSQVGQGRGTTAAEIAGAIGGVAIGNEMEKRSKITTHYDVVTRLQGGGTQTITYATQPSFRVGDKVRVENGVLVSDQ